VSTCISLIVCVYKGQVNGGSAAAPIKIAEHTTPAKRPAPESSLTSSHESAKAEEEGEKPSRTAVQASAVHSDAAAAADASGTRPSKRAHRKHALDAKPVDAAAASKGSDSDSDTCRDAVA